MLILSFVPIFSLGFGPSACRYSPKEASISPHNSGAVLVVHAAPDTATGTDLDEETIGTSEERSLEEADDSTTGKRLSSKQIIPTVGIATLSLVSLAAKSGELGPYADAQILQDFGAALLTGALGYIFVKGNTWLAEKGYLDPRDSRKIVHLLSAPLFILFWPIFSTADGARYFAAAVSFVNMARLYIAGSGGDKSLAYAVSRSGNQNEALGGPFLYVVILFASILLFWRDSPVGIVALSAMAAGDGLADLIGRRYGKNNRWPFNPDKSIAGSAAFAVGGTLCATILLNLSSITLSSAVIPGTNPQLILAAIMLVSALLEVIPGPLDDNWVVPLSAAVMASIAFS